jgi:putative phage-type endonuclease
MNREQFLLDRKKGIGGSDVASILGVSPYRTALEVYQDKTSPELALDEPTEDMQRGVRVEKYILQEYAEHSEVQLDANIPTIVDKQYPFMRANIDAMVVGQNVVIEAKSTKAPISTWEKGIPEYYKAQVAYYAMLADAEYVEVPVLFSGWKYACFTYWRDEAYETSIKEAVIHFWQNHIVKNIPPKPTSTEELIAAYPVLTNEKTIKADNDIRQKVYQLQEIGEQRKELEKKEKQLKTQIQGYMGDAGLLDAGFCKLALKEIKSTRFDANAFKEKYTELYRQYLNDSSYRKLQFIGG